MKELFAIIYAFALSAGLYAATDNNVCDKVLKTFRESFPCAKEVNWKATPEFYSVNFYEDNVRMYITYRKDGNFFRSVRYYKQSDLPYYLQVVVAKKYAGKKVFGIIEVADAAGIGYYVKLMDGNALTTLRMDANGKLELIDRYTKLQKK